jgi:hypothetical protein
MSLKIGFAILTHNQPEQLLRLVKTLNAQFDRPAIACHHDFGKCPLDETLFPPNVRFVHPHIVTRWGSMKMCLAALSAFRVLRKCDVPDWFFLLSGSDYLIAPGDRVVSELAESQYDAYLDHRELTQDGPYPEQTALHGFGRPDWVPLAFDRYGSDGFWWPRPNKTLLLAGSFPFVRKFKQVRHPKLGAILRKIQSNRPARVYGGDFWLHGNQRAIDRLLDPSMQKLIGYFTPRPIPEESMFHTALCNEPMLRVSKDHKRYVDWTKGGAHPKWLDVSDLPALHMSGAYFARKIQDPELLARLDDELSIDARTATK